MTSTAVESGTVETVDCDWTATATEPGSLTVAGNTASGTYSLSGTADDTVTTQESASNQGATATGSRSVWAEGTSQETGNA